ncbi:hypothetical protein C3489_27645 [Streptomyces sp. Ru71]|nr:hypothetical protein C3489_27645 [Streptomyces sp. Ru71]
MRGVSAWAGDEPYAGALHAGRGPLFLRRADGWLLPLEVERWCADADAVDLDVLDHCEGAVLDVGCGPGRLVAALAARGRPVLGLDVSEAAAASTRRRLRRAGCGEATATEEGVAPPSGGGCGFAPGGVCAFPCDGCWTSPPHEDRTSPPEQNCAPPRGRVLAAQLGTAQAAQPGPARAAQLSTAQAAQPGTAQAAQPAPAAVLCRSVFAPLPREGRWGTALLLDGNIGIGGDPHALLVRLAHVLAPGGLVLAETAPVDVDERVTVRLTGTGGAAGTPFPWARLGTPALVRHARRAGWRVAGQWTAGGRCFVALRSRHTSSTAEPPKRAALISSQRVRKPSAGSPAAPR